MRDLREITVFPFESMSSRQSAYKLYGSPSGRRILIGHKNHVMALRRIGPRMLEYRRNKRLILGHSTYPSVIRQFLCLYSGRIQREKGWSAIYHLLLNGHAARSGGLLVSILRIRKSAERLLSGNQTQQSCAKSKGMSIDCDLRLVFYYSDDIAIQASKGTFKSIKTPMPRGNWPRHVVNDGTIWTCIKTSGRMMGSRLNGKDCPMAKYVNYQNSRLTINSHRLSRATVTDVGEIIRAIECHSEATLSAPLGSTKVLDELTFIQQHAIWQAVQPIAERRRAGRQ